MEEDDEETKALPEWVKLEYVMNQILLTIQILPDAHPRGPKLPSPLHIPLFDLYPASSNPFLYPSILHFLTPSFRAYP
jgi:hypothetical protein